MAALINVDIYPGMEGVAQVIAGFIEGQRQLTIGPATAELIRTTGCLVVRSAPRASPPECIQRRST